MQQIQPGDTVAYSEPYIDKHGRYDVRVRTARGAVKAVRQLALITVADIDWDQPGLPKRVSLKNLVKATQPAVR